mgnify:CR=1 FL=1
MSVGKQLLAEVQADCNALRRLLEDAEDGEAIRAAYAKLEGAAFRSAESMYADEP